MPRILITGANGFIGNALALYMQNRDDVFIRKAYRRAPLDADDDAVSVGDVNPETDWSPALQNVDVVVHCAARVHVMRERSACALADFRSVNVQGTQNLARQSAVAGVKRFVFISSIKVNGESTTGRPPFSHLCHPAPTDAYAISKWEAEQALWVIAKETGLEVTVVRPPLVYGPEVKANFRYLLEAIDKGLFMPFGAKSENRRSMVYVRKSMRFDCILCTIDPKRSRNTFLVSDGRDLNPKELVTLMASPMDPGSSNFNTTRLADANTWTV